MNVKIQGGGKGVYSNKGSCYNAANYLEHEKDERPLQIDTNSIGFFNNKGDNFSKSHVIKDIDANKSKLRNEHSKFFVITVSPSDNEIKSMGNNRQERTDNMKAFINSNVMQKYAEGFNKNLSANDIKYYSIIHQNRGNKEGDHMHAHIIVSRKTEDGHKSISPQTNHRHTEKGAIKGGFNRKDFFLSVEKEFDNKFKFDRPYDKSFQYLNALKNGSHDEMMTALEKLYSEKSSKNLENHKEKNNNFKELKSKNSSEQNFSL